MFKINNIIWRVLFVPSFSFHLVRPDGSVTLGCCDNNIQTIFIDYNLKGSLLYKVLCHEITHAAMFSYDIYLTIEQEELVADLIGTYGYEIIQ